eukprot:jgi/Mesvir1/7123/Mv09225-RA.1
MLDSGAYCREFEAAQGDLKWTSKRFWDPTRGIPTPPCDYSDLYIAVGFAILIPLVRFILNRLFFDPLATSIVGTADASGEEKKLDTAIAKESAEKKKTKMTKDLLKCKESCWKLTYYSFTMSWGIFASINEPWFWDTDYYWRGFFLHEQFLKFKLQLLYFCQLGYYCFGIIDVLYFETKRSDRWVMLMHHLVTSALIFLSYVVGYYRIGSIVMLLHDVCDVFMEASKVLHYAKLEAAVNVTFPAFAIVWVLTRLTYYPFWVIHSALLESWHYVLHSTMRGQWLPPYWLEFNTLLILLLLMNIYWFVLIIKMAVRQVRDKGRVKDDIREEDYDSDD